MSKQAKAGRTTSNVDADPDGLSLDGLDGLLGYRVRHAQVAIHRDFMTSLASLSLTQKQVATLWLIGTNSGASQAALANALDMDRATMMAVIDRLEERGFVNRQRSVSDRRRQELHLTPLGQASLKKAKAKIAEHERRMAQRLKSAERRMLLSLLRKIADA